MRHLKKFNEHKISIFDKELKKLLPNKLEIVNSNGNWILNKSDLMLNGDLVQFSYYQKTFDSPNHVSNDGEPDYLCFDVHFDKNGNGLKTLVDITYGDAMVSEFSIEHPNKVDVIHYTGKHSKYDPDGKFAFTDKSLQDLINLFNRLGYNLNKSHFKFLDNDDDSYYYKDDHSDLYVDKIGDNKKI